MNPTPLCRSCGLQIRDGKQLKKSPCDRCQLASELLAVMPPEIWTTIFRYLSVKEQLAVRSTCQRWKHIVDGSPSLRGLIVARLSSKTAMDHGFNPGLPPASNVSLAFSEVTAVDGWWPAVGQRLVSLKLDDCRIARGTFWEMLRQTTILKELQLSEVSYLEGDTAVEAGADFQLVNLEKLVLVAYGQKSQKMFLTSVLDVFPEICPRLKYLALSGYSEKKPFIKMVKAAEATLQGLKFDATKKIMEALAKLKQLELKHVAILRVSSYDPESFDKFFRTQPNIVDLSICQSAIEFLTHEEFSQLKLVRLKVELNGECTLNIGHMPTLEYLEVTAYYYGSRKLTFGSCQTPNMREIRFFSTNHVGSSLANYLFSCPRLQFLRFGQSIFHESVNLGMTQSQNLTALRTLKIDQSNVPRNFLLNLLRRSPNLEHLELMAISEAKNDIILQLCRTLKRLKRLSLECWITDAAAFHIINNHGSELRELDYRDVWPLKDDTKKQLLEHFKPLGCAVRFCWKNTETYHLDLMQFS